MKTTKKITRFGKVIIDPAMNKYSNVIHFPKKLEHANKVLETAKLPEIKGKS